MMTPPFALVVDSLSSSPPVHFLLCEILMRSTAASILALSLCTCIPAVAQFSGWQSGPRIGLTGVVALAAHRTASSSLRVMPACMRRSTAA